jgi:protein O-GlcNAc transferase
VHEFAVLDPAHSFAYWPGFSLNPGVWDLAKLTAVVSDHHHSFQEDSDLFERIFSLRVWLHGSVVCDHIGTNASAYVLNGLPRRFD